MKKKFFLFPSYLSEIKKRLFVIFLSFFSSSIYLYSQVFSFCGDGRVVLSMSGCIYHSLLAFT